MLAWDDRVRGWAAVGFGCGVHYCLCGDDGGDEEVKWYKFLIIATAMGTMLLGNYSKDIYTLLSAGFLLVTAAIFWLGDKK